MMPGLRILLVSGIFPPDHGGPATYVPVVASALSRRHTVAAVVALSDEMGHEDSRYGFPVVRIRRRQNRVARSLRIINSLFRLSRDVDVVYVNGLLVESVIACRVLRRKRTIVKIVGDWAWEKARNERAVDVDIETFQRLRLPLRWGILRVIHRWAIRRASRIIAPSRYLAGIVEGWGVARSRIRVVYNGSEISTDATIPESAKRFDLVTVARLVPWKGVAELCRLALRHRWTLLVIGDGPLRVELEEQVKRAQGTGLVRFRGHVPKDRVAGEMAIARIFVLNSTYEGLPHVILEAKAAGLPVIATAAGGTPEVVIDGRDGFLVPVGDEEALAARIAMGLRDPALRRRLGDAGRNGLSAAFSVERMIADTEAVLAEPGE